jgi:hypothetical protein
MGPISCPETSVQNYHSKLRNIPKERRSHLRRGGSLKSRRFIIICYTKFIEPNHYTSECIARECSMQGDGKFFQNFSESPETKKLRHWRSRQKNSMQVDSKRIECGVVSASSEQDLVAGFCNNNKKCSGFIIGTKFLDQVFTTWCSLQLLDTTMQ